MGWIKLDNDVFAEENLPDPKRIINTEQLQQELQMKQQEITMYENEITHLISRKEQLQLEINDINSLLI